MICTVSPPNLDLLFFGNNCNLSCRHCYYKEDADLIRARSLGADIETAKRIIERHPQTSIFVYPVEITTSLAATELFPLIGQQQVLTNGVALSDGKINHLIEAGIVRLKVTLFADAKTHTMFNDIDEERYRTIIRNIARCKEKGLHVIINTVLCRSTVPTIPKLVSLCSMIGIDEIEFIRLRPVGEARDSFSHELLNEDDMLTAVETIETLKLGRPSVYLTYNMSCGPDFYGKTLEQAKQKIARNKLGWKDTDYICPAIGMKYFGASMRSGKVYGCLFSMEEKDFFLGDMNLGTGDITIKNPGFLDPAVLSEKLRGNCHKDACVYHTICLGGCRNTAHIFAKQRGEKDPLFAGMDLCVTKLRETLAQQ